MAIDFNDAMQAADDEDDAPADVERREAVVDEARHGHRLDRFLVAVAGEFSRSHLQSLVAAGRVRIDGATAVSSSRAVRAGQRVVVELVPTAESRAFRPEALPLTIVHEDAHVLVVDKPAGLVVHPAAGHWSGTLLNALLARDPACAGLPRAGIVHRLDKDTSGLMVVARSLPAMTALTRAIAAREVQRLYDAIAHGDAGTAAFSVQAPIGRDARQRTRMAIAAGGKPARTDVEPLAGDGSHSLLRCTLHSGRTHQIRVHLASRGLPLVGDALYGGRPALGVERQALHAAELAFAHPASGERLRFRSRLPADLEAAWQTVAAAAKARVRR